MSEDEKLLKEAKKLPWEDRLLHKNWKVRNDANIDLAALCDSIADPKDPRLRDFGARPSPKSSSISSFFRLLGLRSEQMMRRCDASDAFFCCFILFWIDLVR